MNQSLQQLELKHLAPYLPYGLNIAYEMFGNKYETQPITTVHIWGNKINNIDINQIKPLLIPLSQITKSQWFSILMQGLHQTSPPILPNMPQMMPDVIIHSDLGAELNYMGTHYSFSYDFKNNQFESHGIRFNHVAVLEELYKNHADVNHLIDAGLALNKLDFIK